MLFLAEHGDAFTNRLSTQAGKTNRHEADSQLHGDLLTVLPGPLQHRTCFYPSYS